MRMNEIIKAIASIPYDKVLHAFISYVVAHILCVLLHVAIHDVFLVCGISWAVTVFLIGVVYKEFLHDKERADSGDFAADLVGGTLSVLITLAGYLL